MSSDAVLNSENCSEGQMVVIDIYKKLEKLPNKDERNDVVSICLVPKSLSSVKPEAFIPQLVGLGPYHHFRAELIMTDELKLGVTKRVPEVKDLLPHNADELHQRLQNFFLDIQVQAFYHLNVLTAWDHHTLLYVLTVDGLFLLALLHIDAIAVRSNNYYFLTGKQGMPLVNAAGVEVTMDGIVRDVFMLENQIPIHVLKKISQVDVNSMGIQQENSLGQTMIDFCRPLSPLVHLEQLPGSEAEERYHLLDLMYHWIVQEPVPESLPEKANICCCLFEWIIKFPFNLIRWIIIYPVILILTIIWVFLLYSVMFILQGILQLFTKSIPWAVGPIFGNPAGTMPSFKQTLNSAIHVRFPCFKPKKFPQRGTTNSSDEAVTMPSAMELSRIINFEPADGGISSVRYDEETGQFYLPRIRLDATSEVIITNLVAYESLIKSHGELIFMRFIELMSALIVTSEDVKLLVGEKIIQTKLSDEVVLQFFNGMMRKSICSRPSTYPRLFARIAKLEAEVAKVNYKFDSVLTLDWFKAQYKRIFAPILTAAVLSPAVKMVFVRVYCLTLFRYINNGVCSFHDVEHYGRNITFTSSM